MQTSETSSIPVSEQRRIKAMPNAKIHADLKHWVIQLRKMMDDETLFSDTLELIRFMHEEIARRKRHGEWKA